MILTENYFFHEFRSIFVSSCTAIFVCIFFQAGWAWRGRLSVKPSIEKSRRNVENISAEIKSARMRYKLRSSTKNDSETSADRSSGISGSGAKDSLIQNPVASTSKSDCGGPPEKKARICCRRKVVHKASLQSIKSENNPDGIKDIKVEHSTTILNLGVDIVLYLAKYLDATSLICLYRSCHYFYDMLRHR